MSDLPRVVAFSGSLRQDSFNQRLVRLAAAAARQAGAEVMEIELRDFPLPLFDQDLEREETPDNATRLKQLLVDADGLLIASPEYNSSVTAALKNAIDWASRPAEGEPPLVAFQGKVAAIMSASPGGLGGLRGLVHLRSILGNIGVILVPEQVAVSQAHSAFTEEGTLQDERKRTQVERLGIRLAELLTRLKS